MQQLLKSLFESYYKDVYAYLYSLCHDADLSEELAAEVFLEVVRSIAGFRGKADLKTWLFSIARHRWYRWLRQKKRRAEAVMASELYEGTGQGAEEAYMDRFLAGQVRSLLQQEPPRTREIVGLRMKGYSFYEIAQQCGISENSARVIDFRARARIRKRLQEEGLADGSDQL